MAMNDHDVQVQVLQDDELLVDIHEEYQNQCRSSIILRYIDQYPESLARVDDSGSLPLHLLLRNKAASIDTVLMVMEKYPAAVQHQTIHGFLPLHIECRNKCRLSLVSKLIDLYPEALSVADQGRSLPLHYVLQKKSLGLTDLALMMIEKYPTASSHADADGRMPIHIECKYQCRSAIISKCIELYPESLAENDDDDERLPLHILLNNKLSTLDQALLMIEKYPAALQCKDLYEWLPIHLECFKQCRPAIMSKYIELYPHALDNESICKITGEIYKSDFHRYKAVLSIIFTARPMSLYEHPSGSKLQEVRHILDIRKHPTPRRRILNLLPRHVFTATHDADYRDLNWQPRAAVIMLLSQMKLQQQSRHKHQALSSNSFLVESLLA
jgi:ankyrin repeat protein